MITEKEKMLAGMPYDCGDSELINRWHLAKQLQRAYNNTPSDNAEELSSLLDELVGSRGKMSGFQLHSSLTMVRTYTLEEMWK